MKSVMAILILLAAVGMPTCYRTQQEDTTLGTGTYYYWHFYKPITFHGICATMYSDKKGENWYVEHPTGFNPVTKGSTHTDIEKFPSRQKAESWIEARCPTK